MQGWNEVEVTTIEKSFHHSGVFNDGKWPLKLSPPPALMDEHEFSEEDEETDVEELGISDEPSEPLNAFQILMSRNK